LARRAAAQTEQGAAGSASEPRGRASRLVKPLRRGAARARALLARLLRSTRARAETHGRLQAFHDTLERIEKAVQTGGLDAGVARDARAGPPGDPTFGHLRARLEALLAVLLEIGDDRLAGQAASGLEAELVRALSRAEEIFARPEALFGLLDLRKPGLEDVRSAFESGDLSRAGRALLERLRLKSIPEGLSRWLLRGGGRVLDEARLVSRGFFRLPDRGARGVRAGPGEGPLAWVFLGKPIRWESLADFAPHEHAELALLARASASADDEALLSEVLSRLVDWAARVPPDGPAWDSPCLAERLLNWAACFIALRRSAVFTQEVAGLFLRLVYESASLLARARLGIASPADGPPESAQDSSARRALSRAPAEKSEGPPGRTPFGPGHRPTNAACALARAGAALAVSAALFDELEAAATWASEGRRLLAEAAATGVLPDGGPKGGALEPHESLVDALVTGALAQLAAQVPPRAGFSEGAAAPESVPAGAGETLDVLRPAADALEFLRSLLLPDGTLCGLRRGTDPSEGSERRSRLELAAELVGLARRAGAAGAGFRAFSESGCYLMKSSEQDCLLVRTKGSHEIVAACGGTETPAVRLRVTLAGGDAEGDLPKSELSRVGPPCDYVRRVSGLPGGGLHRREVVHVERRYWVLAERLRREGGGTWTLELEPEPEAFSVSADGRRFAAGTLFAALPCPTDCGFRAEEPGRARVELAGADVQVVMVLYPLRGEDASSIAVEPVLLPSGRAVGARVRRGGFEDIVAFPGGEEARLEGRVSRAQVVVLSRPAPDAGRADSPWRTLLEIGDGAGEV